MLFRKKERFTEYDEVMDVLKKRREIAVRRFVGCRMGSEESQKALDELNKIDDLIYNEQRNETQRQLNESARINNEMLWKDFYK